MAATIQRVILDLMTGSLSALSGWIAEDPSRLHQPLGPRGFLPLHWAVQHGHHNLAAWLLSRGADVNALTQGEAPCNALTLAAGLKKPQLVRMLVRAGADPWQNRAAWMAAYTDDVEFLAALEQEPKAKFAHHIWPAQAGSPSTDMLLAAIEGGAWNAAQWLVEKGWQPHRAPLSWPELAQARWEGIVSSYQHGKMAGIAKPRRCAKARL